MRKGGRKGTFARELWRGLAGKLLESIVSVAPIAALGVVIALSVGGVDGGLIGLFAAGAVFLIVGMGLFTLGADVAMMPMGGAIGSALSKSRRVWLILAVCFVTGVLITVAEPDLQVLAGQLKSGPGVNVTLVIAVAVGVGAFLTLSLLKTLFRIRLQYLLVVLYAGLLALALFVPADFLAVSFDSGGVTTGPITVPFLMALGLGVASVRGGSDNDSFGMIALCSVGPILAVMLIGLTGAADVGISEEAVPAVFTFADVMRQFGRGLPLYFKEVAIALSPIVAVFFVFQFAALKLPKVQVVRIVVGIVYTYVGLSIFLTGVNVGFMPLGKALGQAVGGRAYNWILIPVAMVMGLFVVLAEPAVHVLNKQVEEATGGAIKRKTMLVFLMAGVSAALGLSMVRVLYGVSIWWFLAPGYGLALIMSFFVPGEITGIAFDAGGVASGPMTATFILPFAMGACAAAGGSVFTDAFGLVAFVALAPLITIQLLGLIYRFKARKIRPDGTRGADPGGPEDEPVDFDRAHEAVAIRAGGEISGGVTEQTHEKEDV